MPPLIAAAPPRLPFRKPPRVSPDAAAQHDADALRSAFAAAATAFACTGLPGSVRKAAVAALDAAVRVYVTGCRRDRLPSEQALILVSDVTRRHAFVFPRPGDAAALRDVVFCAFLTAFYGDDRVRCPSPAWRAPHRRGGAGRP